MMLNTNGLPEHFFFKSGKSFQFFTIKSDFNYSLKNIHLLKDLSVLFVSADISCFLFFLLVLKLEHEILISYFFFPNLTL